MPIRRWHGWGAQCHRCGEWVDLGEMEACKEREHVKDSLEVRPGECIEDAIGEACGCQAKKPVQETPTT